MTVWLAWFVVKPLQNTVFTVQRMRRQQ